MTKELIHIDEHRGQLHCDNPACGHELQPGEAIWGEHLIGYSCPECGANMLTRQDYEASERFHHTVRWLNKWFGWLGSERGPDDTVVSFRHHDGKIIIKPEK